MEKEEEKARNDSNDGLLEGKLLIQDRSVWCEVVLLTVDQLDVLQVPWTDGQAEEEFPSLVVNITEYEYLCLAVRYRSVVYRDIC